MSLISEKQRKVAEYYKQQERLLEGYNDMDTMTETGLFPGSLTEVDYFVALVTNVAPITRLKQAPYFVTNVANAEAISVVISSETSKTFTLWSRFCTIVYKCN